MLDGDDTAIHTATIAQQPQIWSIREHHSRQMGEVVPSGPSLNGFLPTDLELIESGPTGEEEETLYVTYTDSRKKRVSTAYQTWTGRINPEAGASRPERSDIILTGKVLRVLTIQSRI